MIKKANKRYFQLLEVMIAIFLIAVCAVPIMGSFVGVYKDQKELVRTIRLDHIAHLAFAKAAEDLYRAGARGDSIKDHLHRDIPLTNFHNDPEIAGDYDFFYYIDILKPRPKQREASEKLLLSVSIKSIKKVPDKKKKDRTYDYKLFVSRKTKLGQNDLPEETPKINKDENKTEKK